MSAHARRYLLGGSLLAVVVLVLPAGVGRDLLYSLVAASGAVVMAFSAHRNRPARPAAWYLIAAGMGT